MLSWSRNGGCSNNEPAHRQNFITARRGFGALALLCSVGAVVRAQEAPPGFLATLDVTQRLEYSDNPDLDANGDSDIFGRSILNFGLESVTSIEAFTLNLGTDIEEGRDDRTGLNFTNTIGSLGYNRNTRNALLGIDGRYSQSDSDGDISEEDFDQDGNVINQNDGTRKFYDVGIEGAFGREAPIGANFAFRYSESNYSGVSNARLRDSDTTDLSGQIDFRINPSVTANLTAKYIDFDAAAGGVNRETVGFGAGVDLRLSPIWSTSVSLSYDDIDRSGAEDGSDEGITGIVNVTREMPNGSLGLNFESDVASNENSRRTFLAVTRSMELPRGDLSYSLGVTGAGSVIGLDPLVNVDFTHNRPTQQISLGLSQQVNTDTDNEEQLNTSLNASFDQQINNTSSFGVGFSFFDRNELGDNQDDGHRWTVEVTYRHDLTRDWGLVGGYSYTRSKEDGEDKRTRNSVFIGLERSFNWTP